MNGLLVKLLVILGLVTNDGLNDVVIVGPVILFDVCIYKNDT